MKRVILGRPFTGRLSRDCAASLHVVGTSPAGYLVLGTEEKDGCIRAERWQLSYNTNVVQHDARAEVANNHPARLSPHTPLLPNLNLVFPSSRNESRLLCQHESRPDQSCQNF